MAVLAGLAQADPFKGELGILDVTGNNPATGAPWAPGDTYRFAFYTSGKITAESADISTYNAFIQGLANATGVYDIGASDGVTWNVIGSTADVDARDNTSTNSSVNGTGESIFLLDGSTLVANDYADLWDGSIQHVIDLTEQGTFPTYFWPCTGTYTDGTKAPGHGGSRGALGDGGEIQQGNAEVTTDWVWRVNTSGVRTKERPLYAMSDPLVIVSADPNAPDVDAGDNMISWSGEPVILAPDVTNNDPKGADLTYHWSAENPDPNNITIVFAPAVNPADPNTSNVEAPTVTIANATDNPSVVTLTLAVNNVGRLEPPVEETMTIDVYDDACEAAKGVGPVAFGPGDFNADCITDLADFAELAAAWLYDYTIIAPEPQ